MPKRVKNIIMTGYMCYWAKFHQTSITAQVQTSRMYENLGIVAHIYSLTAPLAL